MDKSRSTTEIEFPRLTTTIEFPDDMPSLSMPSPIPPLPPSSPSPVCIEGNIEVTSKLDVEARSKVETTVFLQKGSLGGKIVKCALLGGLTYYYRNELKIIGRGIIAGCKLVIEKYEALGQEEVDVDRYENDMAQVVEGLQEIRGDIEYLEGKIRQIRGLRGEEDENGDNGAGADEEDEDQGR